MMVCVLHEPTVQIGERRQLGQNFGPLHCIIYLSGQLFWTPFLVLEGGDDLEGVVDEPVHGEAGGHHVPRRPYGQQYDTYSWTHSVYKVYIWGHTVLPDNWAGAGLGGPAPAQMKKKKF